MAAITVTIITWMIQNRRKWFLTFCQNVKGGAGAAFSLPSDAAPVSIFDTIRLLPWNQPPQPHSPFSGNPSLSLPIVNLDSLSRKVLGFDSVAAAVTGASAAASDDILSVVLVGLPRIARPRSSPLVYTTRTRRVYALPWVAAHLLVLKASYSKQIGHTKGQKSREQQEGKEERKKSKT